MIRTTKAGLFVIVTALLTLYAAQTQSSEKDFDTWQNTIAPLYIWGVSLDGELTLGRATVPLKVDFADAISDLEGTFTIHYEGAKGHWGIIADYYIVNIAPEATGPGGQKFTVDFANTIIELSALYRFSANNPWQLLAGVRSYKLDAEIKTGGGLTLAQGDDTFNDFIIGGRYFGKLSKRWSLLGRLDIGTGDSDFVWNAAVFGDWRFHKTFSVFFGYRILDYDISQGSGPNTLKYSVTHSGPLAGVAIHW